jgi:predicted HTH transcriptional regulator
LGESDEFDLKENWQKCPKIAKHILAIANSGGGIIVFGIKQKTDNTFESIGLNVAQDKADLGRKIKKFIPTELNYEIYDFNFPDDSEYSEIAGKIFQVIIIEDCPRYLPFISMRGSDGIDADTIYVRRKTESVKANNYEIERIIARRIKKEETNRKNISEQLVELKSLYDMIPKYIANDYIPVLHHENYNYPTGDFEKFILKMIEKKKRLIEENLNKSKF